MKKILRESGTAMETDDEARNKIPIYHSPNLNLILRSTYSHLLNKIALVSSILNKNTPSAFVQIGIQIPVLESKIVV